MWTAESVKRFVIRAKNLAYRRNYCIDHFIVSPQTRLEFADMMDETNAVLGLCGHAPQALHGPMTLGGIPVVVWDGYTGFYILIIPKERHHQPTESAAMNVKILTEKDIDARTAKPDKVFLDTEKLFRGRKVYLESTDGGYHDKGVLNCFQDRFGSRTLDRQEGP